MSGLFGDLDIEGASDNPFEIPTGTNKCHVTDVEAGPTKDGTKQGVTIIYTIDEGEEGEGLTIRDWKEVIKPADPKNLTADEKRAASFIKLRLKDLGVPDSRMNKLDPQDLLGKAVLVTTAEGKNGFPNIKDVELNTGESTTGGPSSNPFA